MLAADSAWGIAALLWITSGLARLFWGGKEPGFYWANGFFWVKMALFGAILLLEVTPMVTLIRIRAARGRGRPLPPFSAEKLRRINHFEAVLLVAVVFVAAFMARGAWLF